MNKKLIIVECAFSSKTRGQRLLDLKSHWPQPSLLVNPKPVRDLGSKQKIKWMVTEA